MNFSIPFSKSFKYLDEDNVQLYIKYKPKLTELKDFVEEYKSHRIVIFVENFIFKEDLPLFKVLLEKFKDVDIIFCFSDTALEEVLSQNNIPHFYSYTVHTWNAFYYFLSLDVTDIIIGGDLLFNITFVSDLAKAKHKKLRCVCNEYQNERWPVTNKTLKNFFVRPEDISLYENYIDTWMFSVIKKYEFNVLYRVYAKEHIWFGKLNEIIKNFPDETDNRCIVNNFGQRRLNCGKACNLAKCNYCDLINSLSHSLKAKNQIITS